MFLAAVIGAQLIAAEGGVVLDHDGCLLFGVWLVIRPTQAAANKAEDPAGPPYSSGIGSSHKTDNNFQMIETATCAAMIGCQMLFVPTTTRRAISPG